MKRIFIILLMLCSVKSFSEDLIPSEQLINDTNPYFGIIEKRIVWKNKDDEVMKIEDHFAEKYIIENGITIQICYLREGVPYLYEMYYSEKAEKETTIRIKRDYVDKEDNILLIEVELVNNSIWKISNEVFQRYQFMCIENYIRPVEDESDMAEFNFETPLFSGMSNFRIENEIKTIDKDTKEFIKGWLEIHKYKDFSFAYKGMIKTKINNIECILALQESNLDIAEYNSVLLYYYYIGRVNGFPVLMIMGFNDGSDNITNS